MSRDTHWKLVESGDTEISGDTWNKFSKASRRGWEWGEAWEAPPAQGSSSGSSRGSLGWISPDLGLPYHMHGTFITSGPVGQTPKHPGFLATVTWILSAWLSTSTRQPPPPPAKGLQRGCEGRWKQREEAGRKGWLRKRLIRGERWGKYSRLPCHY